MTFHTTKHTPGPWAFRLEDGEVFCADDEVQPTIAYVLGENTEPAQYEADLRLIVAAPDMFAALLVAELASEELCRGQDPANECWVTLATIRAALAKAGIAA